MDAMTATVPGSMVDSFGRKVDYVRISVTDRCNLRCRYCMAEHMQFLPKRDILTLEEIVARQFVDRLAKQRGITLPKGDIFSEQAVKAVKTAAKGKAAPGKKK